MKKTSIKTEVIVVSGVAVIAWLLWVVRSQAGQRNQGAPEGSLATDPHTQSLLLQDINARKDGAVGITFPGRTGSHGPLVIDITKDCTAYGSCP